MNNCSVDFWFNKSLFAVVVVDSVDLILVHAASNINAFYVRRIVQLTNKKNCENIVKKAREQHHYVS